MFNKTYKVIGVMSGTSLDGIDIVTVEFNVLDKEWSFKILGKETISYSEDWVNQLKKAITFSDEKLRQLNENYTILLGSIIKEFITKYNLNDIDAVCSHGHTILHQPQNGLTLQIGNLPNIAKIIGVKVVCDFRVQDVKLGGQGAPLVPIGDRILFSEYDYCLNLGGFSNISFEENNRRIAFDISPVNTVLNYYSNKMGLNYDDKGEISRKGNLDSELLNELNNLEYYSQSFPKSLGFEFVKEIVLPLIEKYSITYHDKMFTFTEHIAIQTAKALPSKKGKILVTGGGAYNIYLMERMQFHLPTIELIIPDSELLEYKEALIFALLGVLKLRNEINVLGSVTGAKKDHSSGMIY